VTSGVDFIADHIIGCELDGQSVTLEPGGQFELSGAPVDTLHQTCAEVNQHLSQVGGFVLRSSPALSSLSNVHSSAPARAPVVLQSVSTVTQLDLQLDIIFIACVH
jgi:Glutamate-cysteine ligase family 2(GCS2)